MEDHEGEREAVHAVRRIVTLCTDVPRPALHGADQWSDARIARREGADKRRFRDRVDITNRQVDAPVKTRVREKKILKR